MQIRMSSVGIGFMEAYSSARRKRFRNLVLSKTKPLLNSRLTGDLDNELLQDPAEGVNYFKNTLKKHFLKGKTSESSPTELGVPQIHIHNLIVSSGG